MAYIAQFSGQVVPSFTVSDKPILFLMGIAVGLVAGIFEELGWTGFAVPTLLRLRYGVLGTGLIVGVLWGAWHLPINFWEAGLPQESSPWPSSRPSGSSVSSLGH